MSAYVIRVLVAIRFLFETWKQRGYLPCWEGPWEQAGWHLREGSAVVTVVYKCGHTRQDRWFGNVERRDQKLAWFKENVRCPECEWLARKTA